MKCLMAESQQRAILDAIPEGGKVLEWGGGGTTEWLIQRLPKGAHLTTVEHDGRWCRELRRACGNSRKWSLIEVADAAPIGANARPWEECPAGLDSYIHAAPLGEFDVFLIDGVGRAACLAVLQLEAKPGARVFLHDTQRTWYRWAMRGPRVTEAFEMEPEPGEYPANLWGCTLA